MWLKIGLMMMLLYCLSTVASAQARIAMSLGKDVYAKHCMTCHQVDGAGAQNMIPPLIRTDYVLGNKSRLIQLVLHGMKGDIKVNGEMYSGEMPAHDTLSDRALAAVLTYIRNSFGNTAGAVTSNDVKKARHKILIVYLSRTKNTKAVAEMIRTQVGGTLVPLELVHPYPENYKEQVAQVVKENSTGFLPPLKTRIDSIAQYDIVFIGFPTWDMKMPPPVKSFLKAYDLGGKTVIPFNTNAGYGVGSGFETVKQLCPKSKVPEGFSTKGGVERDGVLFVMEGERERQVIAAVNTWLKKLSL